MAKVSWLGATYQDVPAVSLPDGDGGESVFYEGGGGESGLIPPIETDRNAGYINGTATEWVYEDPTQFVIDNYAVEGGVEYYLTLGTTVGSRLRAMFTTTDIRQMTSGSASGVALISVSDPYSYEHIVYTPPSDGFILVAKSNSGEFGIPTYLYDLSKVAPTRTIIGAFKGRTTGSVLDIDLPYTGSGWPISITIFPTEGVRNSQGEMPFNDAIQRYACQLFCVAKSRANRDSSTSSTDNKNFSHGVNRYKDSAVYNTSYSQAAIQDFLTFFDTPAESSVGGIARMRSKKKLSVYIASSSYGFMANVEYTYIIAYSS